MFVDEREDLEELGFGGGELEEDGGGVGVYVGGDVHSFEGWRVVAWWWSAGGGCGWREGCVEIHVTFGSGYDFPTQRYGCDL